MLTKITDDFYIDLNEVVTLSEYAGKCYVKFKEGSAIEFNRDRFSAIKERFDILLEEKIDDAFNDNESLSWNNILEHPVFSMHPKAFRAMHENNNLRKEVDRLTEELHKIKHENLQLKITIQEIRCSFRKAYEQAFALIKHRDPNKQDKGSYILGALKEILTSYEHTEMFGCIRCGTKTAVHYVDGLCKECLNNFY